MYHRRIPRKIFIVGPIKVHKVHKVTLANVSIHESPTRILPHPKSIRANRIHSVVSSRLLLYHAEQVK